MILDQYFSAHWKSHWDQITKKTLAKLSSEESAVFQLEAENTDFLRFNQTKVRQSTSIHQAYLTLDYFSNQRNVKQVLTLSGDSADFINIELALARARAEVKALPQDPLAVMHSVSDKSFSEFKGQIPSVESVTHSVAELFKGADLAGLYAGGTQISALVSSAGADHWFSTDSLNFNYSLFTKDLDGHNRAVKSQWAGNRWDLSGLQSNAHQSLVQLKALERPTQTIKPGNYRVYMSPEALNDLIGMFNWNGLSYRAYRLGGCAMAKLFEEKRTLSNRFTLQVNYDLGLTPQFNSTGAKAPVRTRHFENGKFINWVVSDRTSKEYGVPSSGAEQTPWGGEYMRSYEVLPGDLDETQAFEALGTGLYLSHLHYLNWSDVNEARITGMTRYVALWVENGKPVGPIKDMRFDVSLYKTLGADLEALSKSTTLIPSNDSYEKRSLECSRMPGALFKEFKFTL